MWYPLFDARTGLAMVVADPGDPNPVGTALAVGLHEGDADALCAEHNEAVRALRERPGITDVEAWMSRVFAGALRELLRDALPWRRAKRRSTTGDKPVYGPRS